MRTGIRWAAAFFACAVLAVPTMAGAAPILQVDGSGILTGATGIDVGGTLYDVQFVDGSCEELFDGCDSSSNFDFPNLFDGIIAGIALNNQIFASGDSFDTNPALTRGCEASTSNCVIWIPFPTILPGILVAGVNLVNNPGAGGDLTFGSVPVQFDFRQFQTAVWADFTPSATAVPEPTSLLLLGTGLVGAGARRWRQRKAS